MKRIHSRTLDFFRGRWILAGGEGQILAGGGGFCQGGWGRVCGKSSQFFGIGLYPQSWARDNFFASRQ